MKADDVQNLLETVSEPMTAKEIAEVLRPETSAEQKRRATARATDIVRALSKYRIVEVSAMGRDFPHTNYWSITRD